MKIFKAIGFGLFCETVYSVTSPPGVKSVNKNITLTRPRIFLTIFPSETRPGSLATNDVFAHLEYEDDFFNEKRRFLKRSPYGIILRSLSPKKVQEAGRKCFGQLISSDVVCIYVLHTAVLLSSPCS